MKETETDTSAASILLKSLGLCYKCAPLTVIFILIVTVIMSIVPSLHVLLTRYIIDALVSFGAKSVKTENGRQIFCILISWGALLFVSHMAGLVNNLLQGDITDRVVDHINRLIIHKTTEIKDLYNYEDPLYYDDLSVLQSQSGVRPVNLLANVTLNLKNIITVCSLVLVLLTIDYRIPIILIATLLPHVYVTNKFNTGSWLAILKTTMDARRMNYYSSVMLSKSHIKEIQLFDVGGHFLKKYRESFAIVYDEKKAIRHKQALLSVPTLVVSILGNLFIMYIVILNVISGNYSYGTIAAFIAAFLQINYYLVDLIQFGSYLNTILLYFKKLFAFLDWKSTIEIGHDIEIAENDSVYDIEFRSVSFQYPHSSKLVLNDVSFAIKPKEKLAIVGENGMGKSTIVKLLLRYYDPVAGEILYKAKNIKEYDVDSWRKIISAVFQDYSVYNISLQENIAISDLRNDDGIDETRCYDICKSMGLHSFISNGKVQNLQLGKEFGGIELSGGQLQRVAIARAFYRNSATIMVMDEPTASLDPLIETQIYKDFAKLSQDKTTIMVTHRLGSVTQADKMIVLKDGKIIESGNHETLIRQDGEYAEMFNTQARHYRKNTIAAGGTSGLTKVNSKGFLIRR